MESVRHSEPGTMRREARGHQVPDPSRPGPRLTTHTEALGPPLQRSGLHSGRPVAFHHDSRDLSQSETGPAPSLDGQPIVACQDRKLFRPDGVSTDALDVPVAVPAVLTGGSQRGPVSEKRAAATLGVREGRRGGAGVSGYRPRTEP